MKNIFKYPAILGALLLATACLAQPHPAKNNYNLRVEAPQAAARPSADRRTLLIGTVTAAAGFDNRGMVYKVGPDRFESDFYNAYVAPPARLLADQSSQYLDQASSRFRVVKTPGLTLAQYGLETYLEAFYGDYTLNPPQAVLAVRYTFNDLRGSAPKVIWDKTYRSSAQLRDKTPDALAEAQGRALSEVLAELNRDIAKFK